MFTPDTFIDAVQNGKKQFVNTFVQHDGIKRALTDFIDGQTAYTKALVETNTKVGTRLASELVTTDFTKFFKVTK